MSFLQMPKMPTIKPPTMPSKANIDAYQTKAQTYDPFTALKEKMAGGGSLGIGDFVSSMPGYSSITGPNGELDPRYKFTPGGAGYDGIKGLATATGPSDMYKSQVGLIDATTRGQIDDLRQEGAIGTGSGLGMLASSGGLDSGARERMAASGNRAMMEGGSNIFKGAALAKGNAGVADAGMKYDAMGRLAGMDNQAQAMNLGNTIGDLRGRDEFAMGTWGKLGDIYGTGVAADAMSNAANAPDGGLLGGGGFLGTGIGGEKGLFGTGIGTKQQVNGFMPMQNFYGSDPIQNVAKGGIGGGSGVFAGF